MTKSLSQISTMQSGRDALLENVTTGCRTERLISTDKSVTENTRVSYPINHIKNIVRPISSAPAAKNVIFLSADAFGVLPPVSILTAGIRHSTTSCLDLQQNLPVQSVESQSLHQHSQLASDRHSLSFILLSMLRSLLRRWRRAELRLTL